MRRNYVYGRRRKKSRAWLWILLLLLIAGGAAYIYLSPKFERIPPEISLKPRFFWAPGQTIRVPIRDNQGLGSYEAILSDGSRSLTVASGQFDRPLRQETLQITLPKSTGLDLSKGHWALKIEVNDRSLWNLGRGNRAVATARVVVDTQPPRVGVVAHSPSVVRGGSGLVVFRATDAHLKRVYVQVGKKEFQVLPYRAKGYWATLLAWPFRDEIFAPTIVAVDQAGNRTEQPIGFERIDRSYRVSWIKLSDRFLQGKIAEIARLDPEIAALSDPLKRFKAVNEDLRQKNEALIHHYTSKPTAVDFSRWRLRAFYPLKSAKRVADFGDERHYYYRDRNREVSRSWHLGYDLASTRHAPIISSNPATVVFAGFNGIYGNMPILDHGFGLYTLYGHCSSVLVSEGEHVRAGQVIARTGKTGLALGDHLHFGILVQGVEVWPMDWMKQNWIKSHIDGVFREADRIIGKK
ncbi:M23 family metallopeptidase [Nitratifractor salsuginis]|uniref:Peptidase M23 n=1 Tax=Nitratifractor salsuginis (strain DSM 16511 / JCM 12458 / E9I37-1) TaxID=749222 RepID=E6X277_NITSE|nr:M23 family metallopeptidase [Nitratifractor salsuginis]ADV47146.1 Peptidase M23 [Nitratifractor salsuginis DSM 16511]